MIYSDVMNKLHLAELLEQGSSYRKIAASFDVSYTTVRYWVKKHGLRSKWASDQRTWNDAQLRKAAVNNVTMAGVLREIGLDPRGANYRTVKQFVAKLDIDVSHFTGRAHGTSKPPRARPLSEVLRNSGRHENTSELKRRLWAAGKLERVCALCGLPAEWKGKPLMHRLDHINGNSTDHRLKNLRIICPNCDSQLPTYCSKNKVKRPKHNGDATSSKLV